MNIKTTRQILKNNPSLHFHDFINMGSITFIPHILYNMGLFPSTSEVKRQRPDLWRDAEGGETITIGRIHLTLYFKK